MELNLIENVFQSNLKSLWASNFQKSPSSEESDLFSRTCSACILGENEYLWAPVVLQAYSFISECLLRLRPCSSNGNRGTNKTKNLLLPSSINSSWWSNRIHKFSSITYQVISARRKKRQARGNGELHPFDTIREYPSVGVKEVRDLPWGILGEKLQAEEINSNSWRRRALSLQGLVGRPAAARVSKAERGRPPVKPIPLQFQDNLLLKMFPNAVKVKSRNPGSWRRVWRSSCVQTIHENLVGQSYHLSLIQNLTGSDLSVLILEVTWELEFWKLCRGAYREEEKR